MATVVTPHGSVEVSDSSPIIRAHDALAAAARRICAGALAAAGKPRRNAPRYVVPEEACMLVAMMPRVLSGAVSPEEAMATLNTYDVLKARLSHP